MYLTKCDTVRNGVDTPIFGNLMNARPTYSFKYVNIRDLNTPYIVIVRETRLSDVVQFEYISLSMSAIYTLYAHYMSRRKQCHTEHLIRGTVHPALGGITKHVDF